jgi:hypothetical protein
MRVARVVRHEFLPLSIVEAASDERGLFKSAPDIRGVAAHTCGGHERRFYFLPERVIF